MTVLDPVPRNAASPLKAKPGDKRSFQHARKISRFNRSDCRAYELSPGSLSLKGGWLRFGISLNLRIGAANVTTTPQAAVTAGRGSFKTFIREVATPK